MKRVCVIDIAGVDMRMLSHCPNAWINTLRQAPRAMRATFPAIRPSVQASITTGATPGVHGVIGGAMYRRQSQEVSLGERSNTLLSKKRFWRSAHLPAQPKTGLMFWSNPLAGAADVVIGADTYSLSDGEPPDTPRGLYRRLADELGPFDPYALRGPRASWRVCEWIVAAAERVWQTQNTDLLWVYLPGVNFEIVRHGPLSPESLYAFGEVESLARRLSDTVASCGGETVLLSDGGYNAVTRSVRPNLALRRAGLLNVMERDGREFIDPDNTRAFAMADHQVAHVYCQDAMSADEAQSVLTSLEGVAGVHRREEFFCDGPGLYRAGERILTAARDAWFHYRWWEHDAAAPRFARRADTHGKGGYDPCEFFADVEPGEIRADENLVRASKGLVDIEPADQCFLAATCSLECPSEPSVTDVPQALRRLLFPGASEQYLSTSISRSFEI